MNFFRRFGSALALVLGLGVWGSAHGQEPLEPEQAFAMSVQAVDANGVEVRWKIADGYYMYRDKFRFVAVSPDVRLGTPAIPAGMVHDDENFGRVEIHRREVSVRVPVAQAAGNVPFVMQVTAQGCWDQGVCYSPMTQAVKVGLAEGGVPAQAPAGGATSLAPDGGSETAQIARLFEGSKTWLILATFFGFGLLLSLTPCVLPMVPILSGLIVNHGHAVSHGRAFVLSLAYVLGMAATYAGAGVAAGLSGTLLSSALQNGWVLGSFALVFVVLALSMFGLFELQMPSALQSRISQTANRQGGSVAAIALMGALSALIVGPCVAAPLAGALLYIAQTGDAWLGGGALFSLALGMGVPLLLVGVFSRSLLPKTGGWMKAVNRFFGVLLLATALWLLTPVLSADAMMAGWAALLIIPSIYMHALEPLGSDASGWKRLWKGVGVVLLITGSSILLGLLGGVRDPLRPLAFLRGATASVAVNETMQFQRVTTSRDLDARLTAGGQPVMLDFYADWCVSCKELERNTFSDPRVQARLRNFTLLKIDVTANTPEDKALLKRFGLFGPPSVLFFGPAGQERREARVIGYQAADRFLETLDRALR